MEELVAAKTVEARFARLTKALGKLGLETVNYGVFGPADELIDPGIRFLTTMRDDWMDYYYDARLAHSDSHVLRLQTGKLSPYVWGESLFERLDQPEYVTANEAADAGLRSTLCVPLVGPADSASPVGAINLGPTLPEAEFRQIIAEHGASLVTIAHLFHNASLRQVWRERAGYPELSARERECLRHLARGRRNDAIAHAMGLATVTVEVHLRGARQKLKARTSSEMVAKAILFGDIDL